MTRFNIRYRIDDPLPDDEWLADRLALFRRYPLASMRSQTIQPTRWLVICDAQSPDWFKEQLTSLLSDPYEPVWLPTVFGEAAAAELISERRSGASHLITTRLDNDDAISRDYLAIVQAHFNKQPFALINLTRGAQAQDGRFYSRSDPSNAFISLIEEADGDRPPRTVWLDQHHQLHRHGPIVQVRTHPTWMQMVHGANIANSVHGVRVSPHRVLAHFDIDVPFKQTSGIVLLFARLGSAARLFFRVLRKPARLRWLIRVLR